MTYIFCKLTEYLILRGGATSMICDITNSLEAIMVQYSAYTSVMWKTWSLQCTDAENGLYNEVGDSLYPEVTLVKLKIFRIYIFISRKHF